MTDQSLSAIVDNINILERHGETDPTISSLVYDSRDAAEGSLFFALHGIHSDGHDYIPQAVEAGAAAVIHSSPLASYRQGLVYLRVEDTRRAMSPVAAAFYGHPSREMTVIGVTGTDGKSTTVSFIHQLLEATGRKTGFLSTVQFNTGGATEKNYLRQSTPEAPEVHRILRRMRDTGCSHAVVEATSHGLSERNSRLRDIAFDIGVFTNISREHLEFHKTFEQYLYDKANLFRLLKGDGGRAVINMDDPSRRYMSEASSAPVIRYSLRDPEAELYASSVEERGEEQRVVVRFRGGGSAGGRPQDGSPTSGREEAELLLPLPGRFNVENLLAATGAVLALTKLRLEEIAPHVSSLVPVRGRMVPVRLGQPFRVLVDYAHTPGSFEKLFPQLRRQTTGRLIALFGSAGERDIEKRSRLGEIASQYSDIVVLADEDPRGEEPGAILREVAAGCTGTQEGEDLIIIEDRVEAMRRAFFIAREGDLVVLLGKGHEGTIIYADGPIPWDEEETAVRLLREMGYGGENTGSRTEMERRSES